MSAPAVNLKHLVVDIQCSTGIRYNDPKPPSTRHQAYAAHKVSPLVVRVLGEARFSQSLVTCQNLWEDWDALSLTKDDGQSEPIRIVAHLHHVLDRSTSGAV